MNLGALGAIWIELDVISFNKMQIFCFQNRISKKCHSFMICSSSIGKEKKKSMTSKTDQNKKKLTTAQWSMSFMEIIGFVTHFHTLYWYSICFPSISIGNLTHNPLPCYTFWMRDHSRFSIDVVAFAIKYLMFNQIQKPNNDSIT